MYVNGATPVNADVDRLDRDRIQVPERTCALGAGRVGEERTRGRRCCNRRTSQRDNGRYRTTTISPGAIRFTNALDGRPTPGFQFRRDNRA